MKRVFFLNFALWKGQICDWSSGCLATAYSIEKLFFCNNGISFREEYIEELKKKSENENKKNTTE